ncbi:hypothetical protein NQ250_25005, partial [Escherichia coli]|nr:hypothetical protein [Escherichia coli]
ILRAIIAGDERAAATLAAEHVMRAGADFLSSLHVPDEDASLEAVSAKYGAPPAAGADRATPAKPARRSQQRAGSRRTK